MHKDGQTNIIAHRQSREGNFRGDIYLGLSKNEVDSHYNWLKKTSTPVIDSMQQGNDTVVQRFSPETIRPHPKVPPRKQAANLTKSAKQRYALTHLRKWNWTTKPREKNMCKASRSIMGTPISKKSPSPSPNTGTESRKMMTHPTMSGIV